ncbi:T9SS type A sorting domain-containing protein [uncultured Kordia sp.]|uniref:T9SS type A sorting domain-containing protein n=1 Tax=uncultured Kordia sp. TaxID=507699 RepID=UPI002630C08B|nr:T9SS type A sorting domain-containing protein [uncultured Kordia sp.]
MYSQNAWEYTGIPYTDWDYDPFKIELETPTEWPSTPKQNYYYVDPDNPNATDVIEQGELTGVYGRFGYPDKPRATIPSQGWINDSFTPGTVIWLKGGVYTPSNFYSTWSPQFQGTSSQPIWLYGDPSDKPVFSGVFLGMFNSSHIIVDNLQWIGGNQQNGVLSLTRDRPFSSHHITLRNLRFENLNYVAGGGAIVGINSNTAENAELHDVVAYRNVFKNCGGGFDWLSRDNDHHAYKVNGNIGGNETYRVWIIDNNAIKGDSTDSVDGLFKSLSGNLVQVGDQIASSGGNHHVFVGGNYQEFARQALGWTKRATDVIFSGNYCTETYALAGGNGQCYGHSYDLGDYNWWINNIGTKSSSGWMHTANDPMTGPLFVIGNLFYDNRNNESNDNWRLCSGVTLFSQWGEHYFVNNVFDNNCHGIWAKTNRHNNQAKLHIYNNIFSNISANIDGTSKSITLDASNGISVFIENNLFDAYTGEVSIGNNVYQTLTNLNTQNWASNNISGDPLYENVANNEYNINENSPAIDSGTQNYTSGMLDVYQQYLDRYTNDIYYPGNPSDYWPKDYLNNNRFNGTIDIGAHEYKDNTLGIIEIDGEEIPTMVLTPNPTKGNITIALSNQEKVVNVAIYTLLGQEVQNKYNTTKQINISELEPGVYIIMITSDNGKKISKRIIKE